MRRRVSNIAAIALVAGGLFMLGRPAAAATTVVVDDDGFAAPGDCNATQPAPNTIQGGVNAAPAGGVVQVCPGFYNETVTVNKPLSIQGPQYGIPPTSRTPGGPNEAVVKGVRDVGAFYITASNVSVNGFDIAGNTAGPGIQSTGTTSGTKMEFNIVRNNVFGLYPNGRNTYVSNNWIFDNNMPGPANGNGIYVDQGARSLTISSNTIDRQDNSGILMVDQGLGGSAPISGVTITQNTLTHMSNSFMTFYGGSNLTINGNTMRNDVVNPPGGSGVYLSDVRTVNFYDNTITKANFSGIVVTYNGLRHPSGVNLYGNTIDQSGNNGIDVRDTAFHGVTTYSNLVTNNAANGIFYDRATAGNDIYGNTARANGAFDCRDNSTGGGTSGTANNWWGNGGPRSLPPGICE